MYQVGLTFSNNGAKPASGTWNRQRTQPMSQPRSLGKRSLRAATSRTKAPPATERHGHEFGALKWQIDLARKRGDERHVVAAFNEMANPTEGDWGTTVSNKEQTHQMIIHIARWKVGLQRLQARRPGLVRLPGAVWYISGRECGSKHCAQACDAGTEPSATGRNLQAAPRMQSKAEDDEETQ
jgi:hypothetical protein